MTKLKLTSVCDDKPVRLTISLPAALHRDIVAYAEILARETGKTVDPAKLIAPMLEKFIASDRAFAKARGADLKPNPKPSDPSPESAPATTSRAPD
jgi:hypothetical protein